MLKNILCGLLVGTMLFQNISFAATNARRGISAPVSGPKIVARAAATASVAGDGQKIQVAKTNSLAPQECQDYWFGCMDGFCMSDSDNGGRCMCGADKVKLDAELQGIKNQINDNANAALIASDTIAAGANAEIVNSGTVRQNRAAVKAAAALRTSSNDDDISSMTGIRRQNAATEICMENLPVNCADSITMTKSLYATQIASDCGAYKNFVASQNLALRDSNYEKDKTIRAAAMKSFEDSNKYTLGECTTEFIKCMHTPDACGENLWGCIYPDENAMQTVLQSKKLVCDHITANCVQFRDEVWPAAMAAMRDEFIFAAQAKTSDELQNCGGEIEKCILTACNEKINGADANACLARPEMVESFCRPQIERCNTINPQIYEYKLAELQGMRKDACMKEFQDCLLSDNACGENMSNCIGLDRPHIQKMCPPEKLVICKGSNPNFSISDIDDMINGIYLTADNEMWKLCSKTIQDKMTELCGATTSCNYFASTAIGKDNVNYQKVKDQHLLTGMINWESVPVVDGKIDTDAYIKMVRGIGDTKNTADSEAVLAGIRTGLDDAQGYADRVINLLTADPGVSACINGRDMSQVSGRNSKIEGRFPNIAEPYKNVITQSILNYAQMNQNARVLELTQKAKEGKSAEEIEMMCLQLPSLLEGGAKQFSQDQNSEFITESNFATTKVIGTTLSNVQMAKLKTTKFQFTKNDVMSRETWAVYEARDKICHIYGKDTFCGKESTVKAYVQAAEKSYEDIKKEAAKNLKKERLGEAGEAVAIGAGIAIAAVAANAAIVATFGAIITVGACVPIVGWIVAAAAIIVGALLIIFRKEKTLCETRDWDNPVPF
ncbi:MAG: hypothetical protein LBO08_01355 [Rickettsiales bacterium]|nr:hypothetical protein [Rickettsiales bacterium]